jgi:CBS domain containing-hemolysin-like protein
LAALLCVLANGFFVAAEFALARVRPTALETRARAGDRQAEHALKVLKQLDSYLTATQLGITIASLGLGWLGEPAISGLLHTPLAALGALGLSEVARRTIATVIAFTIISVLHIVIGELVPKSLAILQPEEVTRLTARPMTWFFFIMFPPLYLMTRLSNWLVRSAGVESVVEPHGKLNAEEIRLIVEASFTEGDKERLKGQLLVRVLRATDRPVRALMVPRVDMYTLSLEDTIAKWREYVRKTGFSRYPVTEGGNPDRIVGYIYVKDLLLVDQPAKGGPRALTRDVLFLPESLSVGAALTRFQRSNIPIAIVVDEYGGTSGLITVEDVVEELVGDLQDELDVAAPEVEQRTDGTLIVAGSVAIGDLPIDGLQLDEKSLSGTVSGYIIEQLGRLAHPGDRIQIGSYEATVEDVRRRRIWRVAIRPYQPSLRPTPKPQAPA